MCPAPQSGDRKCSKWRPKRHNATQVISKDPQSSCLPEEISSETPSPQPCSSHLGCPRTIPTVHHPTLPVPSASNTWPLRPHLPTDTVTEAHGPASGVGGRGLSTRNASTPAAFIYLPQIATEVLLCARHCSALCPVASLWFFCSWGLRLFSPSFDWCSGRSVHHGAPAQNSLAASDGKGPQGFLQSALLGCDANTPIQATSPATNTDCELPSQLGGQARDLRHSSPWSLGQEYGDPGTQTLPSHLPICTDGAKHFMSIPWVGWG